MPRPPAFLVVLLAVLALAALAALVLVLLSGAPLGREQAKALLEKELAKLRRDPRLAGASLSLSVPAKGFELELVAPEAEGKVFHGASSGKLFTSLLVARKVEAGALRWEDPVAPHLEPGLLEGLVRPEDLEAVTVADLLAHTSGMADYFAGPRVDGSPSVAELVAAEPGRSWTPRELLDFSRRSQEPGRRGDYLYSDTGFVVLGLLVERLYGGDFAEVAKRELFAPLGMADSYYPGRSGPPSPPAKPLAPLRLGGTELSTAASLSADWAGGGAACTLADFQRLASALGGGRIVSRETLGLMSEPRNRFETGIRYGLGMMRLRFGEFFPLLRGMPDMVGHMGVLGVQVFVEPESGTSVVVSLGADGRMEESVKLLIVAMQVAARLR